MFLLVEELALERHRDLLREAAKLRAADKAKRAKRALARDRDECRPEECC